VADIDDPAVSRRQFFRGLAGDLLKVVGEVTGLAEEPEPQPPRVINLTEGDVIVPPEKQAAALSDLFGFLEQLGAQKQAEDEETAPAEPTAEAEPAAPHEAEHSQA
jgi:hypothetical protein